VLRTLDLRGNKIGDGGAEAIAGYGLSLSRARSLSQSLSFWRARALSLGLTNQSPPDKHHSPPTNCHVYTPRRALFHNTALQKIHLFNNNINTEGAKHIERALSQNRNVHTLHMYGALFNAFFYNINPSVGDKKH
jgi:hypothetical protein